MRTICSPIAHNQRYYLDDIEGCSDDEWPLVPLDKSFIRVDSVNGEGADIILDSSQRDAQYNCQSDRENNPTDVDDHASCWLVE